MADKKFEAPEKYFWADDSRDFAGEYKFGADISGILDGDERLEKWIDDGTITIEKPVSEARADQSKLIKLQLKIDQQAGKIEDLENDIKNQPKNITAAKKEVSELKSDLVEKDIEIADLQKQIGELTAPKKGGK